MKAYLSQGVFLVKQKYLLNGMKLVEESLSVGQQAIWRVRVDHATISRETLKIGMIYVV